MPAPEVPGEGPDPTGPDGSVPSERPIEGDPSGAHDDLPPAEASLESLGIVIPDDASDLENDRQALLDEQARGFEVGAGPDWRRREPPPGLPRFFTGRWFGHGLSGPLIIAVLLTVAVLGSFMTALAPSGVVAPGPQALATAPPGLLPGEAGALLPDTSVQLEGVPLSLQRVRPVVLAVIPSTCASCEGPIANVQLQARDYGLRVMLVGTPDQESQLHELSRSATNGLAGVLLDVDGGLTSLYRTGAPTLVLVHSDGIIGSVVRDPGTDQRFELQLTPLAQPAQVRATV